MAHKAAIAILLFVWCASANAQDQTGRIVFYRESHFRNSDYKPPVFCDGVELTRVVNGSYLEVTAPPGRHVCVAESDRGPATTIDVVPGSVAYLRVDITPTIKRHAFLITTTEAEFKQQKKLTPVATTHLNTVVPAEPPTQTPPTALTDTDSHERTANFGDLAVTTTNVDTGTATSAPDRHEVTVSLTVRNTGKGVVCASFNAKLKATFGFEYLGISSQAPSMQEMLPGESMQGSYFFDVKDGVQPLEMILELRGGTIRCKASGEAPLQDGSIPTEIRLDIHGLPGSSAKGSQPQGTFRPGAAGVGYPRCLFCPDPKYTAKARDAKLEGTVQLKVIIGTDGNATDIEIVKGVRLGLDEQAVNAVRTWRFKPAVGPNGDPVATVVPIEVTFRMLK